MASTIGNATYQSVRPYLFSVAYRMTGSAADAEDLIQDAWIRYLDAGSPDVRSLGAYLTTTISRLALDYLKSARVQREQYIGTWLPEPVPTAAVIAGPADTAEQRESVSFALLLLMESLTPEQRVAYVLREGFALSFDDIATHLNKPAASCRQIYRRARLRVDESRGEPETSVGQHRQVLEQALNAIDTGDVAALAALLADDVRWNGDGGPHRLTLQREVVGRDRVSRGFYGTFARLRPQVPLTFEIVELNGQPAVVTLVNGDIDTAIQMEFRNGQITAIRAQRNPEKLRFLAAAMNTGLNDINERQAIATRHLTTEGAPRITS